MTPFRRAVALLNIGVEPQAVFERLRALGLSEALAVAVLAAAQQKIALTPVL